MEEKIEFKNGKCQKLIGIINIPPGKGPFDAVIFAHGRGSNKEAVKGLELEKRLDDNVFFRFDFSGSGESYGKFEDITITALLDDLESAINTIKKLSFVKNIHLVGSSQGGFLSILCAARNKTLKSLVLICPLSDFKTHYNEKPEYDSEKWKTDGYIIVDTHWGDSKLNYSHYIDGIKYDGYAEAEKIQSPTLIIHGDKDTSVPLTESQNLLEHLKYEKRLEIINGAGHRFSEPSEFKKLIDLSVSWIKSHKST